VCGLPGSRGSLQDMVACSTAIKIRLLIIDGCDVIIPIAYTRSIGQIGLKSGASRLMRVDHRSVQYTVHKCTVTSAKPTRGDIS
jgi:hypothetical protein